MRQTVLRTTAEGFTLVEVLVSLVILSTGIVVILGAFETSAAALAKARDATRAAELAAQQITDIKVAASRGGHLAPAARGSFAEPFEAYRWSYISSADEAHASPATELTLSIYYPGDDVPGYEVTTFLSSAP